MQNSTITLVVAVVGIAGTLGRVVLGQWMSRSWQREQWLLDNRKQEYCELLSAVSNAHMHMKCTPMSYFWCALNVAD
jgi:hypothetical protein